MKMTSTAYSVAVFVAVCLALACLVLVAAIRN